MQSITETQAVRQALDLATLLRQTNSVAIGELVGNTGVGKTIAGLVVATSLPQVYRVCAYEGMTLAQMRRLILDELDRSEIKQTQAITAMRAFANDCRGLRPILVIDEANKLRWQALEWLRHVADECGWAVLFIGTELYQAKFKDGRTAQLLLQLGRRIGAKRVVLDALDKAELAAHVLEPAFGKGLAARLINRYWLGCRKGNWGEAMELRDACKRIMSANNKETLDEQIVIAAKEYLANASVYSAA